MYDYYNEHYKCVVKRNALRIVLLNLHCIEDFIFNWRSVLASSF